MTTILQWKYPLTSLSCLFLFNPSLAWWISPRQKSFHAVMKTVTISRNIFSVNKCQRFYSRKFLLLRKLSSRNRTANVTADMWIFFSLLEANQHQHQCLLLAFISHNLNIFIVRSAMPIPVCLRLTFLFPVWNINADLSITIIEVYIRECQLA